MIAGIDYSTRAVDVVLLDEDTDAATWHRFLLHGQDAFERARNVRGIMPYPTFWEDVLAIGIEDPRGYGAGALYRVQGAILACLPAGLLVQPWIPSAWRKTVGLAGNASKDDVAEWATWEGGLGQKGILWEQDGVDAYCIALATRLRLERKDAA